MPDREKVIKGLERCKEGGSCVGKASKQPKIVRCKDCIYWDNAVFCANHVCVKHSGPRIFATQAEWYCADGERITDDA